MRLDYQILLKSSPLILLAGSARDVGNSISIVFHVQFNTFVIDHVYTHYTKN